MGQPSRESKQAWLERNKDRRAEICRQSRLRREYGVTPEFVDEMYKEQKGLCAICSGALTWKVNGLHVDHDHRTKWVRGLLCGRCNLGIGQFEDSTELLKKAIDYIIANATPTEFVFTKVPIPKYVYAEGRKIAQSLRAKGNNYRLGKEPWNKGKSWSKETKDKMSESAKHRKQKDL
jgi:hypothetical protein